MNLATVARILDKPGDAKAAAIESIAAFTESMGDSSPTVAQGLTQLAWAKVRLGEPGAEDDARKALTIENAVYPKDHYERAVGLTWLGFVLLQQQGRLNEARTQLEEAVALRKKASPSGWQTSPAVTFLAEGLIRQGAGTEGIAMLDGQVQALTSLHGKDSVRTVQVVRVREQYRASVFRPD